MRSFEERPIAEAATTEDRTATTMADNAVVILAAIGTTTGSLTTGATGITSASSSNTLPILLTACRNSRPMACRYSHLLACRSNRHMACRNHRLSAYRNTVGGSRQPGRRLMEEEANRHTPMGDTNRAGPTGGMSTAVGGGADMIPDLGLPIVAAGKDVIMRN